MSSAHSLREAVSLWFDFGSMMFDSGRDAIVGILVTVLFHKTGSAWSVVVYQHSLAK